MKPQVKTSRNTELRVEINGKTRRITGLSRCLLPSAAPLWVFWVVFWESRASECMHIAAWLKASTLCLYHQALRQAAWSQRLHLLPPRVHHSLLHPPLTATTCWRPLTLILRMLPCRVCLDRRRLTPAGIGSVRKSSNLSPWLKRLARC